jgi:hypothetical protein
MYVWSAVIETPFTLGSLENSPNDRAFRAHLHVDTFPIGGSSKLRQRIISLAKSVTSMQNERNPIVT